jgi:ABC-2 type transport system permease protein
MNKIWIIGRHEFLTAVKRWSYIILTLSLPLLALFGMLAYYGISNWAGEKPAAEKLKIGYVDNIGIFDEYTNTSVVTFILYTTDSEAKQSLLSKNISEYFVIPSTYMDTGVIDRYTTKREVMVPDLNIKLIQDFFVSNLVGSNVSGDVLSRVQNPLVLNSVRLDTKTGEIIPAEDKLSSFLMPYAFGMLFMMALFLSSGYLLQGVAEEKENRLIEILLSSVSARQLLIGKVMGLGAAGLVQIIVWLITMGVFAIVAADKIPQLAGLHVSANLILLSIVYFILGYLLLGIIWAAIGSIGASARESSQWTSIVVLPAVMPVALIGLFMTNPNHVIFTILTLFPITAPIMAVMKLSNGALPLWQLILSIVIMIASIAAAMWLASRVFRTFLLMYGKRPSIKEVWRYIREG